MSSLGGSRLSRLDSGRIRFQTHSCSCSQASEDPCLSSLTWASPQGCLAGFPHCEQGRESKRKHQRWKTHLHPSLLMYSVCSLQVTKSSPHSGGSHTGYENQEAEDHWGPLPTSGGCCWDTHINLRPAHLQVHLPREAGIGLSSSFYLAPSPVDSNT